MADKNVTIIIKKKKGGGHGGHHGGAWKVAYADFVTAMMAFFMVMWLMGSDEETKAAISHYFNHPNTPFKAGADLKSDAINPLGERPGQGDTLLKGSEGTVPDDLVPNPVRSESEVERLKQMGELVNEVMDQQLLDIDVGIDYLRFSVAESLLFVPGTSKLKKEAQDYLVKIGRVLKSFPGTATVTSYTDEKTLDGHQVSSLYEASIVKAVAVQTYLVEHSSMSEDRLQPVGAGKDRKYTSEPTADGVHKNRRIEFILKNPK